MRITYIGITLVLMLLSFLGGRFYSGMSEKSNNNRQKLQQDNILSTQQLPVGYIAFTLWRGSSEISPNGRYKADSYTGDYADYNNYYQIFVTDLVSNRMWRIYSGNFRTLGWEWTTHNKVKISYNCGTGCRAAKIMNVDEIFTMSDGKEGLITEENGWEVEFIKSF